MTDSSPIQLRLSVDGQTLELFLPVDYLPVPTEVLLEQVRRQSGMLRLNAPVRAEHLTASLRSCCYGTWIPILKRMPPTPPVDEQVELLVPVSVPGQQGPSTYHAVRAGTPIARLRQGQAGSAGYDLRAGPILVRAPRHTRLPNGENTSLSADGRLLLADCDGEVVLRQMALHVLPSHVHDGDLTAAHGPLRSATAVTIQGNVRAGAVIEAVGDVHIAGEVEEAQVTSLRGSIAVTGGVTGVATRPSSLKAHRDVRCGAVLHAGVVAGQHLHLLATAYRCTLQAGGNVYLEQGLEESLNNVTLVVGGGVLPRLSQSDELVQSDGLVRKPSEVERQHVRVSTQLSAQLALHSTPQLAFRSCVLYDVSAGGARCRLTEATADPIAAVGAIIQVKFELPGASDQVLGIGRVVRLAGPSEIGMSFLQMREHDRARLWEFCQHTLRQRRLAQHGTRADRRGRVS